MKKFLPLCVVSLICFSFAFTTISPTYKVKLGYTCQNMPVAVDSFQARLTGETFQYQIKYCSAPFSTKERYVKFELMFVDKNGNILDKSTDGPALSKTGKLSGVYETSKPLTVEPYDCILSWWYKDVTVSDNDYAEASAPDGTVYRERSTEKDPQWRLVATRSLKLFSNKK